MLNYRKAEAPKRKVRQNKSQPESASMGQTSQTRWIDYDLSHLSVRKEIALSRQIQHHAQLASLQNAYGNQAVLRRINDLSRKLPVSSPTVSQGSILQRKCACGNTIASSSTCAECQKDQEMMMKSEADGNATTGEVPPIVHEVLDSSGQPLDSEIRTFMESRFKQNFGQVRVHTDAKAAKSAKEVNALGYTVRQNIVFGTGQYEPSTTEGQKLIAHELVHVLQQRSVESTNTPSNSLRISSSTEISEQEADQVSNQIITPHYNVPTNIPHEQTPKLQRQDSSTNAPPIVIDIPPLPFQRPPIDLPDLRQYPKVQKCVTPITPISCSDLEDMGGSQMQTYEIIPGVEDTDYVFSCTDEACPLVTPPDKHWLIVSNKSEFDCGGLFTICANGFQTSAEVIDKRPDLKGRNLVSESVALALGLPMGDPSKGVILDTATLTSNYFCCPEGFNFGDQPGDHNLPNSDESVV